MRLLCPVILIVRRVSLVLVEPAHDLKLTCQYLAKESGEESSLLDHAELGKDRFGMMPQWRNTGLRGRPQLLQQGSLVPQVIPGRDVIGGLRVGRILPGSFWGQMGLSEGDVIEQVNNKKMDSIMRWREFMNIAESAQEISLVVERGGKQIRLIIRTIPTHREGARA